MSAQTPEQEPSIEEILASIRQIISDDDEGAPAAAAADEDIASVPEPKPAPEPVAPQKPVAPVAKEPVTPPPVAPAAAASAPVPPRDDILELRDPLPPPSPRPVIDMEDSTDDEDEEEFIAESNVIEDPFDAFEDDVKDIVVAPVTPSEPRPTPIFDVVDEESILGEAARSAALSGFTKLASNMPLERSTTPHRSNDGTTIEDVLRDMLAPMLREWLDENLPTIIEKLVQKELDKLARRASDD